MSAQGKVAALVEAVGQYFDDKHDCEQTEEGCYTPFNAPTGFYGFTCVRRRALASALSALSPEDVRLADGASALEAVVYAVALHFEGTDATLGENARAALRACGKGIA